MSGPDSRDVEMGDGGVSDVQNSKGDGNVHISNNNNNNNNNSNNNNKGIEQTNLLTHTSLTFEVKQDLDESESQQQSVPPSSSPVSTSSKMKSSSAASKKKGTAAAKKGPKKTTTTTAAVATSSSSTSKAPKTKRGAKKKKNKGGPNATNNPEESSDDETDNGPYCICRGPDDHRWMISCDACEDWFHGECVDLDKETGERLVERFVCPNCTDGKRNYTKYKRTCSLAGCGSAARLYAKNPRDRSVFCCADHCDAWWAAVINTLPTKAASQKALEVLTQEDFVGLLASTAEKGGWKLGDKPFGMFLGFFIKSPFSYRSAPSPIGSLHAISFSPSTKLTN